MPFEVIFIAAMYWAATIAMIVIYRRKMSELDKS